MKILITGSNGLLATDISECLKSTKHEIFALAKSEFDITNKDSIQDKANSIKPDIIIHCAAYTKVDQSELEKEKAYRINVEGTKNIVDICLLLNIPLIFFSTDYVFDGSGNKPWKENDSTSPCNYYGYTKLLAEQIIQSELKKYFILRISWLFGNNGISFVTKIIKLVQEHKELTVIDDQIGSPTYTVDVANIVQKMLESEKYGIYHCVNSGYCSWYDFATEILARMENQVKLLPISSENFKSLAKRPKNSRLSTSKLEENGFGKLPHWKDAFERYTMIKGEFNN
ncbi:dTDP-4-dehydrorhamnose reductase [Anaerorhabdus furcosa]|uniref:dTDP-4-dehydrorhamnose reductase n=1 Tax=Anaerorhabdus furcosa TaxID=118967 RepID=A0A1T4NZ23_9FIRM|nr:dTDP-4-dehydrorhamnose reductase [Anaerorhabdus furcosa]SJZ84513.1 dTDP-4-dehydrorhamnose reductase [Anaerorhabdus furcosa]